MSEVTLGQRLLIGQELRRQRMCLNWARDPRANRRRRHVPYLTQADVAAKIGLTRASLANIETGRQKVMLHHVYRILEALKLKSILDLLPARFVFAESAEPVNFAGSAVSENQKIQLEQFIRLAGKR